MRKVYLDHHTASRPHAAAIDAMLNLMREHWGSSAAPHQMGQELVPYLNKSYQAILEVLGAKEGGPFHFFHSGNEAINHLYLSHHLEHVRSSGKNHLLTTSVEEASVLMSLKTLEELGCHRKILEVNSQGQLTPSALEAAINPRTSLLSLSWANGLTGVIHPIADLAEICKAKGIRLHVDASYVIGKLYFRFEDYPIDYLTFDGSLLHSPQGTAGLLMKEKLGRSSVVGVSVGGMAALSVALEENARLFDHLSLETARLRAKFEKQIQELIPDSVVLFQTAERLPNCSAIAFPGVESDALLFLLNRKGIYASLGGGRYQKLSHLLMASQVDEHLAQCALSFSLSYETTEEEVDAAVETIVACVKKLKALSQHLLETQ
jgi:cysteine desulfurase